MLYQQNHIEAYNFQNMTNVNRDNYTLAISALAVLGNEDYIGYYYRGWLKFLCAKSFPTIMTTMTIPQRGNCCHQPPPRVVPVADDAATNGQKSTILRGSREDFIYAFAVSADIAEANVKIRSDIAFSVAVVSQELDDENKIRAYVERAVELNPDNMNAKEVHVVHRTAIHNVDVHTTSNVTTTAIASATSRATANARATSF